MSKVVALNVKRRRGAYPMFDVTDADLERIAGFLRAASDHIVSEPLPGRIAGLLRECESCERPTPAQSANSEADVRSSASDAAARHVFAAEERIERIRRIITRLMKTGRDTSLAFGLLATMNNTARTMRRHQRTMVLARKMTGTDAGRADVSGN